MRKYYEAYEDRYKKIHTEEKISWADETPSKIILEILLKYGANKNSRILEIGCGEGQNAIYLLLNGLNVIATDVSPEAISWCKAQCKQNAIDDKNFFVLDALNNNLREKYDFIYTISTLHMLVKDEDRHKFLKFICSRLKDNGKSVITIMGDGKNERNDCDITKSFDLTQREFKGKQVNVATTSCRIVNWGTFLSELESSGLAIVEKFNTSEISGFNNSMLVIVKKCC